MTLCTKWGGRLLQSLAGGDYGVPAAAALCRHSGMAMPALNFALWTQSSDRQQNFDIILIYLLVVVVLNWFII